MLWVALAIWAVAVGVLLHLKYEVRRTRDALRSAVRPARRCYIEGDTEAEIAETLLRGLDRERVA